MQLSLLMCVSSPNNADQNLSNAWINFVQSLLNLKATCNSAIELQHIAVTLKRETECTSIAKPNQDSRKREIGHLDMIQMISELLKARIIHKRNSDIHIMYVKINPTSVMTVRERSYRSCSLRMHTYQFSCATFGNRLQFGWLS